MALPDLRAAVVGVSPGNCPACAGLGLLPEPRVDSFGRKYDLWAGCEYCDGTGSVS